MLQEVHHARTQASHLLFTLQLRAARQHLTRALGLLLSVDVLLNLLSIQLHLETTHRILHRLLHPLEGTPDACQRWSAIGFHFQLPWVLEQVQDLHHGLLQATDTQAFKQVRLSLLALHVTLLSSPHF